MTTNPHYIVGKDDMGHWIARDRDGQSGGVFRTCEAALRFAAREGGYADPILRLGQPVELFDNDSGAAPRAVTPHAEAIE
jgi:hypothetical protein